MKNVLIIAGVALDVAVLALSLLLMVAGYLWWGWVALLCAGGLVFAAAWFWRNSPDPATAEREWLVWDTELDDELSPAEQQMLRYGYITDPVDAHAAPAIALTQPALPKLHLLQPRRAGGRHRQDNR
ncbi:MAG TPA: hypothetical protein VFC00_30895 [Micromonosporaceae bacterium]|nr:hypothetical protein [Micromonosporaceae bacterium]